MIRSLAPLQTITYQLQRRRCGKATCRVCRARPVLVWQRSRQ